MKLVAIILTHNEELHLARCIRSVRQVTEHIVVADSNSTDSTKQVAKECGARLINRDWINYATQFNWALSQLDSDTDWVLRIDADEILDEELIAEINSRLATLSTDIEGVYSNRFMVFQGQLISHGGSFPHSTLRLFRYGKGECENRWMDEHIKIAGPTIHFKGGLVDENLKSISVWIAKHNSYASREAVDLLNLEFDLFPEDSVANIKSREEDTVKRWIKENLYARLPGGLRTRMYFIYSYFFRLGFLDGKVGTTYHVLRVFWYRYLVDAKIEEVHRYMKTNQVSDPKIAIRDVLGIDLKTE